MRVDPKQIKELRALTSAGVMECKRALEETGGDSAKALAILAKVAEKAASKKAEREAAAGVVDAYIHGDGRIGVLIEVRCETDFLSRSADLRSLVRNLALQIASEAPKYVSAADVPEEVLQAVEQEAEAAAISMGKPAQVVAQMKAGKVKKYLSQVCLMEQKYIRDPDTTVSQLVKAFVLKSGENIKVANFARFHVGDE